MTMLFWVVFWVVLVFGFVVFFGAPYVPSKKKDLAHALDMLRPLSGKDLVVDLGSGDGVVLRAAASRGARAVGYELNPVLVLLARWLSRQYKGKVHVKTANFWMTPLPEDVTVVYAFAVSRDIMRLAAKIEREATRLDRSLDFISYGCDIPGRTPEKTLGAHSLYRFSPLHPDQP